MYRLRWGFVWRYNLKQVFGGWDSMTPNPCDSPKMVDLSGCEYAIIQAKNPIDYQISTLAACPINNFVEFQTIALAPMRTPIGLKGKRTLQSYFGGLRLVERGKATEVFKNGTVKPIGG